MTGHEILEKMDNFSSEERASILGPFIAKLSPVSKKSLSEWQEVFLAEHKRDEFELFVKEQNKEIRKMVELETSEILGVEVRKALGLEPFDLDTNYGLQ